MPSQLLIALLLCPLPVQTAQEPDHEIHQELRAILATVQNAVNSGNYDAMLPVVSKDIRATPVNQEFLSSPADVSAYFKRWFGPGGFLKKLDMNLKADALAELSADKTWALSCGSGVEHYTLADGRKYDLQTRWTATMVKEADGKWRLRGIHLGTSFLDNSILNEAKGAVGKYATMAGVGGLVVGAALSFFFVRPKK